VLVLPNFSQPFFIESDTLEDGMSAILMQRLISYFIKGLKGKELTLSIYEMEFLAIVLAV
jgi:hypothetical protein